MLDPRTIRALAARPADNGHDLNRALAEEGDAHALASLLRHAQLHEDVVALIAARVLDGRGVEPGGPDEDPPRIEIPWEPSDEQRPTRPWTLERALLALILAHPQAPPATINRIVHTHAEEPGFLIAGAVSARSPADLGERLARAPSRSALHDRMWLDLLSARRDVVELSFAFSTDGDELLREAAARLSDDAAVLERLSHDASRRVRRAVALNPSPSAPRARMASDDPSMEVRACATATPQPRGATGAMRAMARAARALERGGDRNEIAIDAMVEHGEHLDPELAWLAGLVLDPQPLGQVAHALAERDARHPSARAILGAAMVRPGDDKATRAELAGIFARAIATSYVPTSSDARALTGQARLVTFLAELLADGQLVSETSLVDGLSHGALVSDPALLHRWVKLRSARTPGLMGRLCAGLVKVALSGTGARPPACALEAAWADPSIETTELVRLAKAVKPRREVEVHLRGRADGSHAAHIDFDPDPSLRASTEITRVVEALDPWIRLSARAALVFLSATPKALALGGREVRGWHEGVVASQLQRILRAARGSSEGEPRVARLDVHADAAGLAVALLARSSTAAEVAVLLQHGLKLGDGLLFAALVETLWALGRRADVKTLVDAIAARRKDDSSALAAWLLVGDLDRARSTSVLAGALDAPCAATSAGPLPSVYEALTLMERRAPGTLERLRASTRTGQAALVNALARAYPGLVGH